MRKILFISHKGGQRKTTVVSHLANLCAESGNKTLFIDLSPTKNSHYFFSLSPQNIEVEENIKVYHNVSNNLDVAPMYEFFSENEMMDVLHSLLNHSQILNQYDRVLIDPQKISRFWLEFLMDASDEFIIVSQKDHMAYAGLGNFLQTVLETQQTQRTLFRGILLTDGKNNQAERKFLPLKEFLLPFTIPYQNSVEKVENDRESFFSFFQFLDTAWSTAQLVRNARQQQEQLQQQLQQQSQIHSQAIIDYQKQQQQYVKDITEYQKQQQESVQQIADCQTEIQELQTSLQHYAELLEVHAQNYDEMEKKYQEQIFEYKKRLRIEEKRQKTRLTEIENKFTTCENLDKQNQQRHYQDIVARKEQEIAQLRETLAQNQSELQRQVEQNHQSQLKTALLQSKYNQSQKVVQELHKKLENLCSYLTTDARV